MDIDKKFEELYEGWKKGKYTIKDKNGKILGTYSSGGKAQKAMDDLMQKGDYDKLEVSIVESTAAYAKSLEKIANDKALKMLSKSERENLKKIAALLDKEKKEEKEWHDGHEPQGIDDQYVEEMEDGEEVEEAFSMRDGDKRVVDAFYDKKTIKQHGNSILTSDGKTLTKVGMGGQDIAKWVNGKIKIVAVSDVKSTEQILRYMKKSIPSGVFEDYDKNQLLRVKHDEALIAEAGDICALNRGVLRSKSMQAVWEKKCAPKLNNQTLGENKMEKLVDTVRRVLVGEDSDKDDPGTQGDKAEYQKKRKEVAKKFGVESCSALKDEAKRKECYNALDKAHVADHEEQVELAKMKKEGVGELSDKELKSKMKDASTQKETDAACGEMGKRRLKMEKKKVAEKTISKLFSHVRKLMSK